jgi:hypothetical protein
MDPRYSSKQYIIVEQVALDYLDTVIIPGQMIRLLRLNQTAHTVMLVEQALHKVAANKAGGPGYENHVIPRE